MKKDDMIIEVKEKFNEHNVIIGFSGSFSQSLIEELGGALKEYLKSKENVKSNTYRVFSVFIEQTQNVKNYAHSLKLRGEENRILYSSVLLIGEEENRFFVSSGNLVKKEHQAELENRLAVIKKADIPELSRMYRETMRKSSKTETGGAGLGLMVIAKNARNNIEYRFTEKDDGDYFFTLTAYV